MNIRVTENFPMFGDAVEKRKKNGVPWKKSI